jgi:hypothetical protein
LLPTKRIDRLSVGVLACQSSNWFSIDTFGVYGTCSMLAMLMDLVDLLCLQSRLLMFPKSGVKTEHWDAYSIRQYIEL